MVDFFDFTAVIAKRTRSTNTQRAYYRWIERYLEDVANLPAPTTDLREARMKKLPLTPLKRSLVAQKFVTWLNGLVTEGHGRQSLDQARASIVTLAELLADAGHITHPHAQTIQAVNVPPVAHNPAPTRLLDSTELGHLLAVARESGRNPQQNIRNQLVMLLLCKLALRREEVSALRWQDIVLNQGRAMLRVGKSLFPIPRDLVQMLDHWRSLVTEELGAPTPQSALVRRVWKGGRIGRQGLSADGVWLIVVEMSKDASLERVTPDDLRRSVAARMRDDGVSLEEINRLLRHRSIRVTERFLAKIPAKAVLDDEDTQENDLDEDFDDDGEALD
jgi:integrase